jgi:fatty acid amide hydrolase
MDWEVVHEQQMFEIKEKLAKTPRESSDLNPSDNYLADLSAEELHRELVPLKKANSSSHPLVKAICLFHARQAKENNEYFALTDILTESAITKAKELDKIITPSNIDDFPLYGYIISVKDSVRIKGQITSFGLMCNMFPQTCETPFIDYIQKKGAVIMSRGNVPQNMFAMESTNNIYGACGNPYDKNRTSGGSSGGDAALVGLGHVNAAIGSDIAGSLRIPALFCGIYAMNLTQNRIDTSAHGYSYEFVPNSNNLPEIQFKIGPSMGPMTRSIHDLEKFSEVIVNYCSEKARIAPIPWTPSAQKITRVGVMVEFDNLFELTVTNRRAMEMAKKALHSKGIETVDIDIRPYIVDLIKNTVSIYLANNILQAHMKGELSKDEPLMIAYENLAKLVKTSTMVLSMLQKVVRDPKKNIYISAMINARTYSTEYAMSQIDIIKEKLVEIMTKEKVGILLGHGMMPAIEKGTSKFCNLWAAYVFIWNSMKFCSGAMPITRVQVDEQIYNSKFKGEFEDSIRKNMEHSEGLPVGIQVVAGLWRDEQVIQVMKLISEGVNFK